MAEPQIEVKTFVGSCIKLVRRWIIGLAFVAILWAIDLSLRPYILKIIFDKLGTITPANIISELMWPVSYYLLLSFLIIIVFRIRDYIYLNLNPTLKRHIGHILMGRMMQHSVATLQNNFAGNLAARIKDVMSGVPDLIGLSDELISIFLGLIIAISTFFVINYKFSVLMSLWLILFISGSIYFTKQARQLCINAATIRSSVVGQLVDIMSNIINIKLFASSHEESSKLLSYLNEYVKADQNRDWYFIKIFSFQGLSFFIYQVAGFWLLIDGYQHGSVTTGDFALLTTLNLTIINNLWSLSRKMLQLTDIWGEINQGVQIALKPIEIIDQPLSAHLMIKTGNISFNNVKFNYPGVEAIFDNLSITISHGQKVGLVGYSGGGKSTFVNLILRLYEIIDGQITIDQQNIQHLTQDSLHQNIAMIPQEPILFHRPLIENIRYGKPSANDQEVIEAAKKANAHNFIISLPQEYNSLVGERGVKLSGGQRQRIAIARAILKNAPILILDEATSQLDSLNEQIIQQTLWNLMQNKTTLVIAHRLSTLMHMDRILVFDQGKIVEDGTHYELIKNNGLYKKLWDTQVGGFIQD